MDETTTSHPHPAQEPLPFDAALDDPIPFSLTARARRVIAPETLPALTLLDVAEQAARDELGDEEHAAAEPLPADLDDPHDTRPARARALRHAGVDVDQIAEELGVDPLAVRAWVDDITPVRSAARRLRPVPSVPPADQRARGEARRRRAEELYAATRASAERAARERIPADPAFVSGLGVLTGVAEVSPNGLVLTTRDLAIARAAVRWLSATVDLDPSSVRVLLRLAPQVAADTTVDRWQRALGLPRDRFRHARWRQAPTADAVEATVRVGQPRVAGAVAGWREALLGSFDGAGEAEHAW